MFDRQVMKSEYRTSTTTSVQDHGARTHFATNKLDVRTGYKSRDPVAIVVHMAIVVHKTMLCCCPCAVLLVLDHTLLYHLHVAHQLLGALLSRLHPLFLQSHRAVSSHQVYIHKRPPWPARSSHPVQIHSDNQRCQLQASSAASCIWQGSAAL